MENKDGSADFDNEKPLPKSSERIAALEERVAQLEGVVQALVVQARDFSQHRHDASGVVLVLPKVL